MKWVQYIFIKMNQRYFIVISFSEVNQNLVLQNLSGNKILNLSTMIAISSSISTSSAVKTGATCLAAAAVRQNWRCIKSHVFNWYVGENHGKHSLCGLLGQNMGSDKTPWLVLVRVLFTSQKCNTILPWCCHPGRQAGHRYWRQFRTFFEPTSQ